MSPVLLIYQFGELKHQLEQSQYFLNEFLQGADDLHNLTVEHAERAASDLAANEMRVESWVTVLSALKGDVKEQRQKNNENKTRLAALKEESAENTRVGAKLVSFWADQLSKAKQWESRARAAVNVVRVQYQEARVSADKARAEHASALSSLRSLQEQVSHVEVTQPDGTKRVERRGPCTAAAQRAESAAKSTMNKFVAIEDKALAALKQAEAELKKAVYQVEGSRAALANSEHVREVAYQQQERSNRSYRFFLDESRNLDGVAEGIDAIEIKYKKMQSQCSVLSQKLALLHQRNDSNFIELRNANTSLEELETVNYQLKRSLKSKSDLLAAFDQPLRTE